MATTREADEMCARLDRMKRLCDELTTAQGDTRKYHDLIERIRHEAEHFKTTLATHDPTR